LAALALSVELWMLLSDVHFLWHPEDVALSRQVVAHVDSVVRRVLVRTPLQLSWQRAGRGEALREGDEIATLDESEAVITFLDAEKLKLGPNSMMRVRRIEAADKPVFRLALLRGSVVPDQLAGANTAPKGRVEIEVAGQGAAPGAPTAVPLGAAARISLPATSPGLAVPRIAAPVASAPEDGTILLNPAQVRLAWRAPSEAEALTVEVARDPAFRQLVLRHEMPGGGELLFHPSAKGHYYWRILAHGAEGAQSVSAVSRFEVIGALASPKLQRPKIETEDSGAQQKLSPPKLRKPSIHYQPGASLWRRALELLARGLALIEPDAAAADTTASEDVHGRYSVKLSWYPVGGAHAYTLQISTDARFNHLVAEKILTEAGYTWHSNVAGFYYWRVSAVDSQGDRGPFSEFMTFEIKADRNKSGDETSYETYLKFDEYAGHVHRFRLLAGPELSNYTFVPNGTQISPSTTRYSVLTARQAQAEYAYRIDNHYSLEVSARTALSHIIASHIEPPGQHTLNQNETTIWAGGERRLFEPSYYWTFEGGIRFSVLDLPVNPGTLVLNTFNFFGFQGQAGITKPVGHEIDLTFKAGPIFMYGDQSLWYGGLFSEAFSKGLTDVFSAGLRFEQELSFYHLESDILGGDARRGRYDAYIFLEFNF
jgi:hypothetical protein